MKHLPTIDVHMHLAATGCCGSGAWISPKLRRRYTVKLLQMVHRVTNQQMDTTFDEDWTLKIHNIVASSSKVDYGVVLGFDGAYDFDKGDLDESHSQMIIPAKWVFDTCKTYSNLLPGPSINPFRKDALELLDYCRARHAVLIKWLPSAQIIDPAHHKLESFFEAVAASGIPLLIHIGGEKTFISYFPEFNEASRLKQALDMGVKIICAHTGTKVLGSKEEDQLPYVEEFLEQYDNFWVDNSGICNPSRFYTLEKLARSKIISERTLYGSDFPVPSNAYYYLGKLGIKKVLSLEAIKNPLDRDIEIKQTFGFNEASLTRAHKVLANLEHWIR